MKMSGFLAAGLLVGVSILGGCAMTDKEGDEAKVPADQLPAAVRETFAKESGGAAIKEADKEQTGGKTVYEADAVINGQNYEIVVAEDGKLVSKKVDNEAGEKSESKE